MGVDFTVLLLHIKRAMFQESQEILFEDYIYTDAHKLGFTD